MKPCISVVTLGVTSLIKSVAFYRDGLHWPLWPTQTPDLALFNISGTKFALYPLGKLIEDIGPSCSASQNSFNRITLSLNVSSKSDVLPLLESAYQAGGTILKPAQMTSWGGYHGYFSDPDNHHWEVVYNPKLNLCPEGFLLLPE